MKSAGDFLSSYRRRTNPDDMIEKLLEDPVIRRFALDHDLKHDQIKFNIPTLMNFRDEKTICQNCPGIHSCKLASTGMTPKLSYYNNDIIMEYTKCRYNDFDESKLKINAMYVPKKIFDASFDDLDLIGDERKTIQRYMMDFLKSCQNNHPIKGMYLSGIFGSGKTYILASLSNELAKMGYQIVFAYYPDLVRELKSSIGTGELEDVIGELKTVDMLFLDDFGGESPSGFIRDEVLGPILQHRLLENKPTFFSSNIPQRVLKDSLALNDSNVERAKSIRIYERVKELSTEFEMREKPRL